MQMALSAMLKAGKPISSPLWRIEVKAQKINHLLIYNRSNRFPEMPPKISPSESCPSGR